MTSKYLIPVTLKKVVKPSLSFEFFPAKTLDMQESQWQAIKELEQFKPKFVSVTYGAGGSTRERTHSTIKKILDNTNLQAAAHLTCVGADKTEINNIAKTYWQIGCKHIVALRGDMPNDNSDTYTPYPNGYPYAVDLVAGLKQIADFQVSVAAYPEGHPKAVSLEQDISYLKEKFAAGADRAITQYFFDNSLFYSFMDKAKAAGITQQIVPGILPVGNYSQMVKFSKMAGASVPPEFADIFSADKSEDELFDLAVNIAANQIADLLNNGYDNIHLYTLNRADLITAILNKVGIS